jgi:hypothetical protein
MRSQDNPRAALQHPHPRAHMLAIASSPAINTHSRTQLTMICSGAAAAYRGSRSRATRASFRTAASDDYAARADRAALSATPAYRTCTLSMRGIPFAPSSHQQQLDQSYTLRRSLRCAAAMRLPGCCCYNPITMAAAPASTILTRRCCCCLLLLLRQTRSYRSAGRYVITTHDANPAHKRSAITRP